MVDKKPRKAILKALEEQWKRIEEVWGKPLTTEELITILGAGMGWKIRGNEAEERIQSAKEELKRLCPGSIAMCQDFCPKMDSHPCEYFDLWRILSP